MPGGERAFELGGWRVEPARGVIAPIGGGPETRLEPKTMDLLLMFAGAGGRVLFKDEIIAAIWSGRAIGDDTLAAAISRLRQALGETPQRHFIETLPKRGYRLLIATELADGPARGQDAPPEAAALLAQGHAALASPLGLGQARLCFEAAVKAAPGWAAAHAALAEAMIAGQLAGLGEGLMVAAKAEARTATVLDEGLAAGWSALGLASLLLDRVFDEADVALRRAIAVDPGFAQARRRRVMALSSVGRFVEAERECRKAVELEPVSLAGHGALLQILIAARRYRPAIAAADAVLRLSPTASEAWYARGWALVLAGDEAAGVDALLKGLGLWGVGGAAVAGLREAHRTGGFACLCSQGADLFESQQILFRPRRTDIAILRASAGEVERAVAALDEAAACGDPVVLLLPWLPHFDPIRADPRFAALLARVRLVR